MKISIGTNIKDGPWGGGNLFAINLRDFLISKGHIVVNDLNHEDIDIILITEPRKTSESSAFTDHDVEKYKKYVNNETLIVHRINECDERKGTNYVNKYLIQANRVADETVYVSKWIMDLYFDQGIRSTKNIIYAGANSEVFNQEKFSPWNRKEKLRIVTHHWGGNWNKGFEIYSYLDNMLDDKKWKELISFMYIGNLPKKFQFKNTKVVKPLSGYKLAEKIKENHLYLTGSINEPSGNHHIEGAQCGLPLLYLESGGTTEYCREYGLGYKKNNFDEKLKLMIKDYEEYENKVKNYPYNSKKMSEDYLKLFELMKKNHSSYLESRKVENINLFFKYLYLKKRKLRQDRKTAL
tara:strand:+ start:4340 stop:5395 length:1056 start_codon:yes stop_codon:yes gene_type:complete